MIHGSWYKARIVLQLLAEERVGAPMRADAAAAKARENAGFAALEAAVGKRTG